MNKTKTEKCEERVPFFAPLTANGKDTEIFASVNGESIRFQRGEHVMIKRKFVEVIENSIAEDGRLLKKILHRANDAR